MPTSDSNDALDRDVEAIRDAVNACRKALADLPLAHKTVVLNELDRQWLTRQPQVGMVANISGKQFDQLLGRKRLSTAHIQSRPRA